MPGIGLSVDLNCPPALGVDVCVQRDYPKKTRMEDRDSSTNSPACLLYLEAVKAVIDILLKIFVVCTCLLSLWGSSVHFFIHRKTPNFDAFQLRAPSWFTPSMQQEGNRVLSTNYVEMVRRSTEVLPSDERGCDAFCLALTQASFTSFFAGDDDSEEYREYCDVCVSAVKEAIGRFLRQCGSKFPIRLRRPSSYPTHHEEPLSSDFVFCFYSFLVSNPVPIEDLSIGPLEENDPTRLVEALQRCEIRSLKLSLSQKDIDILKPLLHKFKERIPPTKITVHNYSTM